MSSPLHIVVLNFRDITHDEAGGAEIYLQEIFGRIAAHGHRVTFLCARHGTAPPEETIDGIRILRVGRQLTINVTAVRAALRLARNDSVDVFVESLCKLPFFMPAVTRIPVVPVVLHLFGSTAFRELTPVLASGVWCSEKLIPLLYRDLPFVALSESTARDLDRRGVRASRMEIVPPGLDLRRYCGNDSAPPHREPLLVYVGRLKRYKGIDIVLRALVAVRQRIPGVRLTLVGKGDDRLRLEALAGSLGLTDSIRFVGFVSEAEKITWLRQAWAVVYPSPKEGWGIATLEAAACGTPVLASDAEGLRDAVRDGTTGFLIPHQNQTAWADRMIQLLSDSTLRTRMAAASRQWASRFDWTVEARKMRHFVEAVVRDRHGGAG